MTDQKMTPLQVVMPLNRQAARRYIVEVLCKDFLGLNTEIKFEPRQDVVICLPNRRKVSMPDCLLGVDDTRWLVPQSLPGEPIARLPIDGSIVPSDMLAEDIRRGGVPVLYGLPGRQAFAEQISENHIHIRIDIFGSCFFMLTRYEEAVTPQFDEHRSFPASYSLTVREGLGDTPIVNIYLDLLWFVMKYLAPTLRRRNRQFRTVPTHDIVNPSEMSRNLKQIIFHAGRLTLKDRDPKLAISRLVNWCQVSLQMGNPGDRLYVFDRLMKESEKTGLTSSFFFMAGQHHPLDSNMPVTNSLVRRTIENVYSRGHEIGLLASYRTMDNPFLLARELNSLTETAERLGVIQNHWGGRQLYLRWRTPQSFRYWDDAGFDYDSSMGFLQRIAFRCGCCYPFRTFDLGRNRVLGLIERPLNIVDLALNIDSRSGSVQNSIDDAAAYIQNIRGHCRRHSGEFVILWHNSSFGSPKDWDLYRAALT